jgi:hypothetical protein
MPWYLGNSSHIEFWGWNIGFPFLFVWSLAWAGLALWYAAKRDEKWWFLIFLVVHTVGILEIIYLFFVVKLFGETKTTQPVKTKAKNKKKRT